MVFISCLLTVTYYPYSMETPFTSLRLHLSPANTSAYYLYSASTYQILVSADPCRIRSVYSILRSISVMDVLFICSNNPTVILCIVLIMVSPSCLNVPMLGGIFSLGFVLMTLVWVVDDKDFYFFSFLGYITILYIIEADIWINTKGFIPWWKLVVRVGCWGLNFLRLMVLAIFPFSTQVDFQ